MGHARPVAHRGRGARRQRSSTPPAATRRRRHDRRRRAQQGGLARARDARRRSPCWRAWPGGDDRGADACGDLADRRILVSLVRRAGRSATLRLPPWAPCRGRHRDRDRDRIPRRSLRRAATRSLDCRAPRSAPGHAVPGPTTGRRDRLLGHSLATAEARRGGQSRNTCVRLIAACSVAAPPAIRPDLSGRAPGPGSTSMSAACIGSPQWMQRRSTLPTSPQWWCR